MMQVSHASINSAHTFFILQDFINIRGCGTIKCENAAICENVAKCEKKINAKCENWRDMWKK